MLQINKEKYAREFIDNLTLHDFLELMKSKDYKPYQYKEINYKDRNVQLEEKKNYILSVFSEVVYEYASRYNRLPTPHEYALYKITTVLEKLAEEGIEVNGEVKKAIYNRKVNGYISFMAEIQAKKTMNLLLSTKYHILCTDTMDFKGVDLAVRNKHTNKVAYIHITSNTHHARAKALEKANKFGRNFDGHLWMFYDKKTLSQLADEELPELSTDTTKEWNNYYFFKEKYIKQIINLIEDKTNI